MPCALIGSACPSHRFSQHVRRQVEKVAISKHLVQSPVVVLSADYGWTAQMEKVMKSQAFADQSKFEFMKSKRMFEINPRHPVLQRSDHKLVGDDALADVMRSSRRC